MSDDIKQLQVLEQNVQMLRTQIHSVKAAALETQTALSSIDGKEEAYQFVGNIMIKADVSALSKELSEKKARLDKQIASLTEQETQFVEKKTQLEKTILGE